MRTSRFLQGMLLGVALTATASILVDAAGAAAGASPVATQNGDINGDSNIDLSDAVSLLNFLFQGGPAPVPIECEEPEPNPPQVRFLNDLLCGSNAINATLEVCDITSISRQTGQAWDQCQAAEAKDTCLLKVSGSALDCGSFSFCSEVDLESGKVYDFVLAFDGVSAPMVLLFVKNLPTDGSCPSFPTPQTTPTVVLGGCASLGRGAALESSPWAAAGGW